MRPSLCFAVARPFLGRFPVKEGQSKQRFMTNFSANCSCTTPPLFLSTEVLHPYAILGKEPSLTTSIQCHMLASSFSDYSSSHKHYSSSFLVLSHPPPTPPLPQLLWVQSFSLENSGRRSICFHVIHVILITRVSDYSLVSLWVPSSGSSFFIRNPHSSQS